MCGSQSAFHAGTISSANTRIIMQPESRHRLREHSQSKSSLCRSADCSNRLREVGELVAKPLDKELANGVFVGVGRIKRVRSKEVSMEESGTGETVLAVGLIDDPVFGALILTAGPPHKHVTTVDHVNIFEGLDRNPFVVMVNLQSVLAWLLEQDGNAAKIVMGANPKLSRKRR